MNLVNRLRMIARVHYLIKIKGTGSPEQLAKRLEISERNVYKLLDNMKELGAPIGYSKARQSYYYEEEVIFDYEFRKT